MSSSLDDTTVVAALAREARGAFSERGFEVHFGYWGLRASLADPQHLKTESLIRGFDALVRACLSQGD